MTPSLPIRHDLTGLPAYIPGRRPDQIGAVDGARLASNESPYGPVPSVQQALVAALQEPNRYPDMACTDLIAAIAGYVGQSTNQIAVGNGSSALIRDLIATVAGPGDEVVFATPSFPYYRNATIAAGATPVAVSLTEYRHDLATMAAEMTPKTRLVFVCNPNNPTGTIMSPTELAGFVSSVPENVVVAIDEAYIEFCAEDTGSLDLVRQYPNVVVLRTFSKAYGLAGLRVGYLVGPPVLTDHVRRIGVPFGVNLLAQAGALASLSPEAQFELKERVRRLVTDRDRLEAQLMEAGLPVVASGANFVFLALGEESASFVAACEKQGIMVRAIGGGVRITVGFPSENYRLLETARIWKESVALTATANT